MNQDCFFFVLRVVAHQIEIDGMYVLGKFSWTEIYYLQVKSSSLYASKRRKIQIAAYFRVLISRKGMNRIESTRPFVLSEEES